MLKLLTTSNNIGTYATRLSAGFDIRAEQDTTISPQETELISTGLYLDKPNWFIRLISFIAVPELQIRSRSGLAYKKKLIVLNAPGTIDADYKDEIKVILHNCGSSTELIYKGDAIAQGVMTWTFRVGGIKIAKVNRQGGFGSTGK